jgi:predicted HicB family RNase H-like nuclease
MYAYKVFYSQDDEAFIATCAEFPSLSGIGNTREMALNEITNVVISTLEWMGEDKEEFPTPIALDKYTGKILLRISPEKHRELALEAHFNHISMNQLIANKL